MSEGTYWAVLTAPILESTEISDGAKLFYAQVSRRLNRQGYCKDTNRELSEELGIGERTVSRYIEELCAAGFVSSEDVGVKDRKRRHERRLRVAVPFPFNLAKNGEVNVAKFGEVKVAKNGEVLAESNYNNNLGIVKEKNNPLEPPTGGPRVPEPAKWKPERFEAFWKFYRQNVNQANRSAARKAWDKLKPDDATISQIGRALKARLASDDEWRRGIGRPHASTYLNGAMWEDGWNEAPRAAPDGGIDRKEAFGVWT